MKKQPTSAVVAGVMSGVAAACVCLTIVFALQSRSLQHQLSDARQVWSETIASTADLRVQQASTSADLTAHRQRLAELQQEVATLESKAGSNVTVSSRPVPVRVFDGNRLVGVGWIPASATNRSGLAGEGVATVFLDRRNSLVAPSESATVAQTLAASPGVAAASSSAYVFQQSPYFWPGVWWGYGPDADPDPDPDPEPPADPQPQPTSRPAQQAQPRVSPAQQVVTRTASQGPPRFSLPVTRPAPFPPRPPIIAPVRTYASTPTLANARRVSSAGVTGLNTSRSRLPVQSVPTRR